MWKAERLNPATLDPDENGDEFLVTNIAGKRVVVAMSAQASPLTLEDHKAAKIDQLDYDCNQTILGGFLSSALGEEHRYGFDAEDQSNLTGRLAGIAVGTAPVEFVWMTKDTGPLLHTVEQFKQVCRDGDAHKEREIAKLWMLKAAIEEATTPEEVQAITWS